MGRTAVGGRALRGAVWGAGLWVAVSQGAAAGCQVGCCRHLLEVHVYGGRLCTRQGAARGVLRGDVPMGVRESCVPRSVWGEDHPRCPAVGSQRGWGCTEAAVLGASWAAAGLGARQGWGAAGWAPSRSRAVVAGRGVSHPGAVLPGAPLRVRENPQVRRLPRGGGGCAGVPEPAAGQCQPPPPGTSPFLLQDVPLLVPLAAPAGTYHHVGCCQTWGLGPQAPRGKEIWGPKHPTPFPCLDARLGGSWSRCLWGLQWDAGGWDPAVPHSVCPRRS